MIEGRPIKYGATTTLRFEIPITWDIDALTGITVSVKNTAGAELATGAATLYTSTTLDGLTAIEATSITVQSDADDMAPGDRVRIGGTGEPKEVREVLSYDSTTYTAVIRPELEYAHADEADVIGMWATFALDASDTDDFPKGIDLFVHWTPDTDDLAAVQQYVVGVTGFATGDLWESFETLYPTEWEAIAGRDLQRFEKLATRRMKGEMRKKGINTDKVQDIEILNDGIIRMARMLVLEGSGDSDEMEYERARKVFFDWVDEVVALPIWQDQDQDAVVDDEETPSYVFCEMQRYF